MKISKKGLIRAGIAITIVWTLIVGGVAYLQYELLSGGDVGVSLIQPDHRYLRKHYWFFDLYTRLLNDEEALRFSSGVNPFGDKKAVPFEGELVPFDESNVPWKVDDLSPVKVLVLNVTRFLFSYLGPLILLWVAGILLAWVYSGFNGTEPEEVLLPQPAPEYTESGPLSKNEIERSKALGFNGSEAIGTPLVQLIPENHESDSLVQNEDKKPKSWALIALHAWGGVCLSAVFNFSKIHVGAHSEF